MYMEAMQSCGAQTNGLNNFLHHVIETKNVFIAIKQSDLHPNIKAFFDPETWTFTYVVYEKPNTPCVVIDSVLNFDPKSGRTSTNSADELITFIQKNHLQLAWILETHAHADHLSAAPYIQKQLGGKIAIGHHIQDVQKVFKGIFNRKS